MKCDTCPFAPTQSEAGDYDDCICPPEYMVTWKDGRDGCSLTYRQLKKLDSAHDQALYEMGIDMGIEMDFESRGWDFDRAIEIMAHTIGLDQKAPYKRNGKKFYRPYRNYYCGGNKYLDYLSGALGLVAKGENVGSRGEYVYYSLTRAGLDFLGRHLEITIRDKEK